MARGLKRWTLVLLGATAGAAVWAATAQTSPPQAVVYVAPVEDGSPVMAYVPVRNAPADETRLAGWRLLKTPMQVFADGRREGAATPLAFSVDDNTMCGGDLRLRVKPAKGAALADDALLASFDLNPGDRFSRHAADAAQRRDLLQLLGRDATLRRQLPAAVLKRLLARLAGSPDDDEQSLAVFRDAQRPGRDVALLTAHTSEDDPAAAGDGSPTALTSVLAVFERGDDGWRAARVIAHHGCDDCEGRQDSYDLLQFADVDADGTIDFVISHFGYESYGYSLLHRVGGAWRTDELPGGC